MFQVKHMETGRIYTVYAVSGVLFLVRDKDHWEWLGMSECRPWGKSE